MLMGFIVFDKPLASVSEANLKSALCPISPKAKSIHGYSFGPDLKWYNGGKKLLDKIYHSFENDI